MKIKKEQKKQYVFINTNIKNKQWVTKVIRKIKNFNIFISKEIKT